MIEHVKLRDFQSWRTLDLDLGQVTMLVGKGNSGKTAIIRALKYALTNQTGDDFIREESHSTYVGFTTDTGAVLLWGKERGKGARYDLNGDVFTKTGSTVPPEVGAAIGIREMVIDKSTTLMPNIQMQFDPPFIIGESGSKVARILGRLTKLNILVGAQMACRTDAEREHNKERSAQEWLAELNGQIDAFPETVELQTEAAECLRQQGEWNEKRKQFQMARDLLSQRRLYVAAEGGGEAAARLYARTASLLMSHRDIAFALKILTERDAALATLADAAIKLDRLREDVEADKLWLEDACKEQGICEDCPWR